MKSMIQSEEKWGKNKLSELTTETTTIIPTTSVVSHFRIISAIGHNDLDDPTKNNEHGIEKFCDNLFINRSTYWRRPGWYRIMGGAEYLMP